MDQLLVLISRTGERAIDGAVMAQARPLLAGEPRWLAPGEAAEAPLRGACPVAAVDDLRARLSDHPIDVCVVAPANRRKRLLVADMDSTIIEQECIDELAEVAGIGAPVRAITARAMRGELVFEDALRERVALLAGLPETMIEEIIAGRISYRPGGRTLVQTMRANGAFTALVSGGFSQFTTAVAAACGFDTSQANELVIEDGKFSGRVREPVLGSDAKVAAVHTLVRDHGLSLDDVLAVGDGANDIDMVRPAGLGVAMHAKPALRAVADAVIDHGDLTALLYLQGYAASQWVRT